MEETLRLTKEQTEIVLSKYASEKNVFHHLMEMMNAMMKSERNAFFRDQVRQQSQWVSRTECYA